MDPLIHAEMTVLVKQQKMFEREADGLREEREKWSGRVSLAEQKGMSDLARQAQEKVDDIDTKLRKIEVDLEILDQEKSMLRHESRRPKGQEVERAEALLDSFRAAGIDPDKAAMDREFSELEADATTFDFSQDPT